MKRWMVVLLVCAGCGASSPTDSPDVSEPGSQGTMVVVRVADVEAYVERVQKTFGTVAVMIDEYTAISQQWLGGVTTRYWTQQYTQNLLTRVKLLQEQVVEIRPEDAEILSVHIEYEEALKDYQEAFEMFLADTNFPFPVITQEVNNKLAEGNVHMIRFQVILSNMSGRSIAFLREGAG